ncbi:MAG: hypothetical protein AAF438_08575 [Pseudomonadota bacterium]
MDSHITTSPLLCLSKVGVLVDVTGRVISKGKRGAIDPQLVPILERLGLSEDEWLSASTSFKKHYRGGQIKVRTNA